jgi:hypothetical protein
MKITKSELKEMIREALREELNKTNLKESLSSKFSIEGFDHEIVDTFEDGGHTGYDIVYAKNGTELVEVEIWDDDSPVTVVENLYSNNLFQRVYDSFDGFAADLTHKALRLRGITEGAMNGGQAEGGFLDTAKRPGGTTSKNKFNALDGKKTKKVLAKDLKPGMITDTGEVKQVTDRGNEIEVSYGGVGNRGSYASDNVAKDYEYEVLDESFDESFDAASGATFAIINKYGSGNYSVWYGFALTAEEETAINDILANHVNEGGSTYGSADEVLSDLNLCL